MSEPRNSGNAADELAEHERGADFSQVNRSAAPVAIDSIPVEGEFVDDGVLLKMRREVKTSRAPMELQEGARAELDAQIFEDPSMVHSEKQNIETRPAGRGALVWWAITDNQAAAMSGDRILVLRDTMESAYSCRECKATGHSEISCPNCKGTKKETSGGTKGAPCRMCGVLGYEKETKHSCGFVPCEFCNGSGWDGGIVKPESTQSAPISGIVVSVGPACHLLKVGDRILHSRYAGHNMEQRDGDSYTMMHEHEYLCLLRDLRP